MKNQRFNYGNKIHNYYTEIKKRTQQTNKTRQSPAAWFALIKVCQYMAYSPPYT